MKDVFVVADAHGHQELVAGLLLQEGLIDESWARTDRDVRIAQLGDLCNCVAASIEGDLLCLGMAREWFDVYLVGNHEYPYFGGPRFSGFWRDAAVERKLVSLDDLIQPSFAAHGVLVTHAGLTAERAGEIRPMWETAEQADLDLRAAWASAAQTRYALSLFSGIGKSRGGSDETGGILWADWTEPKSLAFSQVVGHTPGSEARWQRQGGNFAVCVDLDGRNGNRIGGAWIRESGVEPVVYRT